MNSTGLIARPAAVRISLGMIVLGSIATLIASVPGPLSSSGTVLARLPDNDDPYSWSRVTYLVDGIYQVSGLIAIVLAVIVYIRRSPRAVVVLTCLGAPWLLLGIIDAVYGYWFGGISRSLWIAIATGLLWVPASRVWYASAKPPQGRDSSG